MNITEPQIRQELARFGKAHLWALRRDLRLAGHHPHVDTALCLAVFSRETNMLNIVGDGGHGRGIAQIDDRFNKGSLSQSKGCRNGSFVPVFPSALPAGRVPTLRAGVHEIVSEVEAGVAAAKRIGVPDGERLKFAVAAYNAGQGGAEHAWRTTGDPDNGTTGRDYGADVLERRKALLRWL